MQNRTTRRLFCSSLLAIPIVGLVTDSALAAHHNFKLDKFALVRIKVEAKPSGRFGNFSLSLFRVDGGVTTIVQAIVTQRQAFQGIYGPYKLEPVAYSLRSLGGSFTYRVAIEVAKQRPTGEFGDYETVIDTQGRV